MAGIDVEQGTGGVATAYLSPAAFGRYEIHQVKADWTRYEPQFNRIQVPQEFAFGLPDSPGLIKPKNVRRITLKVRNRTRGGFLPFD